MQPFRSLLPALLLALVAGSLLFSLEWSPVRQLTWSGGGERSATSWPGHRFEEIGTTAGIARNAPPMRLEREPVESGVRDRIVSFADMLEAPTRAVVGVYPSRFVSSGLGEQFRRRYYGEEAPPGAEGGELRRYGLGSGVIISADGYILTNHHVVSDGVGAFAANIRVSLADGRELEGELIGSDPRTDVAVLKVEADELPVMPLADSRNIRVGDVVFAVGNPLGVGLTVTMGIVSATGRSNLNILGQQANFQGYENFIQTDASINPGNSGGALLDAGGRMIGINTAILSGTGGNIGIGFAIPIRMARDIAIQLIEQGRVRRGFLGVSITDLTAQQAENLGLEETGGVYVNGVQSGLPAERAGIRTGDVIRAVDGDPTRETAKLRFLIAGYAPGETVRVTIYRDGQERDIEVRLSDLDNPYEAVVASARETGDPEAQGHAGPLNGVTLRPVRDEERPEGEPELREGGLMVESVEAISPYADRLEQGMILLRINEKPVGSLEALEGLLGPGLNKVYIYDRGQFRYLALRQPAG